MSATEIHAHRDGKGETTVYPCGCKIKRRGRNRRYSFCRKHGEDVAESWREQAGAES